MAGHLLIVGLVADDLRRHEAIGTTLPREPMPAAGSRVAAEHTGAGHRNPPGRRGHHRDRGEKRKGYELDTPIFRKANRMDVQ